MSVCDFLSECRLSLLWGKLFMTQYAENKSFDAVFLLQTLKKFPRCFLFDSYHLSNFNQISFELVLPDWHFIDENLRIYVWNVLFISLNQLIHNLCEESVFVLWNMLQKGRLRLKLLHFDLYAKIWIYIH